MACDFDACTPGTGPLKSFIPNASIDYITYNTFNTSLRSKSDHNLSPSLEGFLRPTGPRAQTSRNGYYAVDTDRGEINPANVLQVNLKGKQTFQARLQDAIKPTTKETTLYSYSGNVAPVTSKQTNYSNVIPEYVGNVRMGGASNYSLRTAVEYSHFNGAAPTGINGAVMQDPDAVYQNVYKRPDNNVDGAGTFKGAAPNGERFGQYKPIAKPTVRGYKLSYNLDTDSTGSILKDYSPILDKNVSGLENRNIASYLIAPLLTNPLHVNWNPENKGELPSFYCNTSPQDYSYMNMKPLEENHFIPEQNFNANSFVLGLQDGLHNERIEWEQGLNNRPGVIYAPDKKLPATCYSGSRSIDELYFNDSKLIQKSYPFYDNTYTTLGDPSAGFIGVH